MQFAKENCLNLCPKHNHPIISIVIEKKVAPADSLLCSICISQMQYQNIIGVDEAREMIKDKVAQLDKEQKDILNLKLENLTNLKQSMVDLRHQLLMNIDNLIQQIEEGIQELNNYLLVNREFDLIKGLQLLQSNQVIEQKVYLLKIYEALKQLFSNNAFKNCSQNIQKLEKRYEQIQLKIIKQQKSNQWVQQNIQAQPNINYKLAQIVKQKEISKAFAFNGQGNRMAAGFGNQIKVWRFDQGQLKDETVLKGSYDQIQCLVYSKTNDWFVSGDRAGYIQCWKFGKNQQWTTSVPIKRHTAPIKCMILNEHEDQLLSGSMDKTIIVWSVKQDINQLEQFYSLENKHTFNVLGLSLNLSETALVSCGKNQLILWSKNHSDLWVYQSTLSLDQFLLRVSFIGENQIIVQQDRQQYFNIYEIINFELIDQIDLKIHFTNQFQDYDYTLFPTIFNKRKQIILQKAGQYVYLIRKELDGQFKVQVIPIDCQTSQHYGTLSEDGYHFVNWNFKTKEFRVYNITYG